MIFEFGEFIKKSFAKLEREFSEIFFGAFGERDFHLIADNDFCTSRQSLVGPEKSFFKLFKNPGWLDSSSSAISSKSTFRKTTYSEPIVLTIGERDLEVDSIIEVFKTRLV